MNKLTPLLPQHRKAAGFAPSGVIEMLLLAYIVAAVLNYAVGNWIFATAMLAPLAGLFCWAQYTDRRDRCKIGDQIQVSLGPHSGMEGAIVGANKGGTRLTVQLSSAEQPEPIDFFNYQIRKVKPTPEPSQPAARD
ncbi:hypothetical protein [Prosthecobacter sp.]|uniref:hypothetical protein n=1 Tax=Prosthecobacter sp. TaxID=1965333 RepID=UPI0037831502